MRKRALVVTLAAAALLVAPVAGVDAKPNGHGKSKKCDKPKRVGFKINGTFPLDGYDGTELSIEVVRANKHARSWLNDSNDPTFDTTGVEKIKFIGITDANADGIVNLADAVVGDRIKLKAKLAKPKRGCEGEQELRIKKIKVKRPDASELH